MIDRPITKKTVWLTITLVICVVLGRLLLCDFTWWDDGLTLHDNRLMNPVRLDTFVEYWRSAEMDIYIPVTYNIWAMVALIARTAPTPQGISLNPTMFHGLNLFTHIIGTVGVFTLLRRILKHDRAAMIGAIFWAIHPVQVESVGWISGYKDVLSGTLAIWSVERFVAWRSAGGWGKYVGAIVLFVLAMLAKPAAMTLPLVLASVDVLANRVHLKRVVLAVLPFAVAAIPIMVIAKLVQPAPTIESPLWARPLIVTDTVAFYILKVIWPASNVIDYGRYPLYVISTGVIWYTWLLPFAVAVALFIAYRVARRSGRAFDGLPLLAAAIFVLAPLHVLGLVRFDFQLFSTVADHYLYIALLGPALLLGWLIVRLPRAAVVGVLVAMTALAARAASLTPVWDNESTLMAHVLTVNSRSWTAYLNLSAYYARFGQIAAEGWALEKAAAMKSHDPTILMNQAHYNMEIGKPYQADLYLQDYLQQFKNVFGRDEGVVTAYCRIGDIYINERRLDDAERYIDEGLAILPNNAALRVRKDHIKAMRNDPNIPKFPSVLTTTRPTSGPAQ